jgi:hypothetical protein
LFFIFELTIITILYKIRPKRKPEIPVLESVRIINIKAINLEKFFSRMIDRKKIEDKKYAARLGSINPPVNLGKTVLIICG